MIPVKDHVTVISIDGLDDWGRPINKVETDYKCRIDYKTQIVKDSQGKEVVTSVTIHIKGIVNSWIYEVAWSDAYGEHLVKPVTVTPIKDILSKVIFTKVMI